MIEGKAPEFDLPSLDGGRQTLASVQGKNPLILVFYKTNCPTCQFTFPFLERLQKAATSASPRIIAISQDDADTTRSFNDRFGITIPTLLDTEGYPASNAYRITNVPTLYLIAPDGRILRSSAGFEKAVIEELASLSSVIVFTPDDRVPVFRPG
jgi:peroxiredoxin